MFQIIANLADAEATSITTSKSEIRSEKLF